MESIWDDKKVKKLKELLDKGLSTSEIGKRLGVSKNTIIGKVHRLKQSNELRIKTLTKESKDKSGKSKKEKNLFSFSFSSKKKNVIPSKKNEESRPVKSTRKAAGIFIQEKVIIEQSIKFVKETSGGKRSTNNINVKDEKNSVSFAKAKEKKYQLRDLKIDMCRWAYGEPNSSNFFFCGEKTFKNKPYCLKHSEMAYVVKKNSES